MRKLWKRIHFRPLFNGYLLLANFYAKNDILDPFIVTMLFAVEETDYRGKANCKQVNRWQQTGCKAQCCLVTCLSSKMPSGLKRIQRRIVMLRGWWNDKWTIRNILLCYCSYFKNCLVSSYSKTAMKISELLRS